jgi:hypothetical protein
MSNNLEYNSTGNCEKGSSYKHVPLFWLGTDIQLFESPDLSPVEFCLWCWMKWKVYIRKLDIYETNRSLAFWTLLSHIEKTDRQIRRTTNDLGTQGANCDEIDPGIFENLFWDFRKFVLRFSKIWFEIFEYLFWDFRIFVLRFPKICFEIFENLFWDFRKFDLRFSNICFEIFEYLFWDFRKFVLRFSKICFEIFEFLFWDFRKFVLRSNKSCYLNAKLKIKIKFRVSNPSLYM